MVNLWMILACVFFSSMSAIIKFTSNQVSLFEIIFYRSIINMIIMSFIIVLKKQTFKTQNFKNHLSRSLLGMFAMYFGFYSLIHLPMGTATTLTYTNPIFQTLISIHKKIKVVNKFLIISVLIGFTGCLILLNPKFTGLSIFAIIVGISGGLLTALAYFNVNKLVSLGENSTLIVFYFSLICTIFSFIFIICSSGFILLNTMQILFIILIGILGSLGQISLTKAYGYGDPVIVGILSYIQVIFSSILGFQLFNETISLISCLGMLLILISGIIPLFLKYKPQ